MDAIQYLWEVFLGVYLQINVATKFFITQLSSQSWSGGRLNVVFKLPICWTCNVASDHESMIS